MATQQQFFVITGASSGIGQDMAAELAQRGYNLILVSRRLQNLQEIATKLERQYDIICHAIAADLSQLGQASYVYHQIKAEGVEVIGLINNAGTGIYGDFTETSLDDELSMLQLNIMSLVSLTKLFSQDFVLQRKGMILNVGSLLSFFPFPRYSAYAASKAFVLSFSEGLQAELAGSGVTVTCLAPGPTDTGFTTDAMLKTNAYQGMGMASSKSVAELGVKSMLAGKRLAIHGWLNWLLAQTPGFTPRAITLMINKHMSSPK